MLSVLEEHRLAFFCRCIVSVGFVAIVEKIEANLVEKQS